MATVAQQVDLPIKIELPLFDANPLKPCVLLGLGDMVLPGFYITFLRRFDRQELQKVYYPIALVSYAIALAMCAVVLTVF